MIPSNIYNALKWVALIGLPPLVTLILGIGVLTSWDAAPEVAGVIALVDTFLGSILQVNSQRFKNFQKSDESFDGYVTPTGRDADTGIPNMAMTISRHPDDFLDQGVVRLKIGVPPPNPMSRQPLPDAEVDVAIPKPEADK